MNATIRVSKSELPTLVLGAIQSYQFRRKTLLGPIDDSRLHDKDRIRGTDLGGAIFLVPFFGSSRMVQVRLIKAWTVERSQEEQGNEKENIKNCSGSGCPRFRAPRWPQRGAMVIPVGDAETFLSSTAELSAPSLSRK